MHLYIIYYLVFNFALGARLLQQRQQLGVRRGLAVCVLVKASAAAVAKTLRLQQQAIDGRGVHAVRETKHIHAC